MRTRRLTLESLERRDCPTVGYTFLDSLGGVLLAGSVPGNITVGKIGADISINGLDSHVSTANVASFTLTGSGAAASYTINVNTTQYPALTSATVNGATGFANSLKDGDGSAQAWVISSANGGTVTGGGYSLTFSAMPSITGGTGGNTFAVTTGSLSGTLNGGGAVGDTLDYSAYAGSVSVNLATKVATGIHAWTNLQALTGNGSASTLIGTNAANAWSITVANSGTVCAFSFFAVANLKGGSNADTFTVSASIGSISDLSTNTTIIDTDSSNTTLNLTGINAGNLPTVGSFGGVQSVTLGSGTNDVIFAPGALLGGTLNIGTGGELDYSAYGARIYVNLATPTATGIGTLAGTAKIVYGPTFGGSTLTGDAAGGDILIAQGSGNTVAAGGGYNLLVGGSGGSLAGGTGSDILIAGTSASLSDLETALAQWAASGGTAQTVLDGTNTHADSSACTLYQGTGTDWFFIGYRDTLSGFTAGSKITAEGP